MNLAMPLIGLFLFAAPAAPTAPATKAEDSKLADLIGAMQRNYNRTRSFEADFEQVYTSRIFRRSERSAGHVSYQRPGKMRFDYKTPTEKSFLVDGKALWIVQPADHQALVDRCFKSDALTSSLTFLFGEGKLAEQFSIGPGKASPAGLTRLVLLPKQPQGAYARLLLDVDAKSARVVASTVVDHQGNTNRFEFIKAVYDGKIPGKRFKYTPPKGITVMPLPGSCNK